MWEKMKKIFVLLISARLGFSWPAKDPKLGSPDPLSRCCCPLKGQQCFVIVLPQKVTFCTCQGPLQPSGEYGELCGPALASELLPDMIVSYFQLLSKNWNWVIVVSSSGSKAREVCKESRSPYSLEGLHCPW